MRELFIIIALSFFCHQSLAYTNIGPTETYEWQQNSSALVLVDVSDEYSYCNGMGHIPGALNFPYQRLAQDYHKLSPGDTIILICQGDGSSDMAAIFLESYGYQHIYVLDGGLLSWINYGLPMVGCVDSDKDGINDDLDNCPDVFNPSQGEVINLQDFTELSRRWLEPGIDIKVLHNLLANWLRQCN